MLDLHEGVLEEFAERAITSTDHNRDELHTEFKSQGTRFFKVRHQAPMKPIRNLTGQRFGRWQAQRHERVWCDSQARPGWWCRCDCGSEKWVKASALTSGHSKSCGCLTSNGRKRPTERKAA